MDAMAGEPIKVLLVEDNPGDVRLLRTMLSSEGESSFQVSTAQRLEEARELLEKEAFDAVILDLGLPDSSGMSTVDGTREKTSENRVPIVVVTGIFDEQSAFDAVKHGAQDFLVKNELRAANLVRAIRLAVERQVVRNRLEDEEARQRHESEISSLENISAVGTSLVTARAFGMERLRESSSDTFDLLVEQYAELIGQAVEQRAFKVDRKTTQGLRVMAQRLGFLRARPRDVVEIHTTALKSEVAAKQMRRAYVVSEEARLLLIELMGYLAAYYRDHMVPTASPRSASWPSVNEDPTDGVDT